MPALLLKELPTIIGIAAILGLLWFIGHGIHENGRKVERAVWLERDNERITAQAKELGEAMERVAAQNRKTMEVINERDQALAKLENDMRTQRAANRGLWIDAKACRDSTAVQVPGQQTGSASKPGGAGQIRLPADVERRLQEIGQLAQETVIKHNACVDELRSLVQVVPDTGS
ncbi:hypothetical protein [Nitrosomonas sp.]|uniref:hypothetical protein n=1 Tax=Nitrosomonas sp. TaxID=42353 RepID=UPI0025DBDEA4|nr:hypothetical protein [Nitrosomonas sp.]MBV6447310.1 hypothetical protein [Nitrosomonas sp.]